MDDSRNSGHTGDTLKEKTAKGLLWSGINTATQQLVGLVFGILLGRLLSPDDYGMTGMIAVFSLIATTLQNSGFKTALINQPQPQADDYNSVFWFNVIVGLSLYVILFFCAPLIALYYHTPALTPLCRYAFLGFVFASFSTAQAAYLTKNMRMKEIAQTGVISIVASSLVGVSMAFCGCRYWSLATQSLVFIGLNTLLLWHHSDWRPTLRIDFSPVRRMFSFSVKILVSTFMVQINANVMNILLGRLRSSAEVGYYNQAYQWSFKGSSLIQNMVMQIDQTVLVGLNSERERQLAVFRKMMRFTAFLSFPLLLGLALVSREFILLAITDKWEHSVGLLQLLCVSAAVAPLSALLYDLIISKGRSDIYMWCTGSLGIAIIAAVWLLHPLGTTAMTMGYVGVNVAWVFVWFFFANRLVGYRLLSFLKDTVPFLLAAAGVMALTALITSPLAPFSQSQFSAFSQSQFSAFSHSWLLSLSHSPLLSLSHSPLAILHDSPRVALAVLLVVRVLLAATLYCAVMKVARVKILDECIAFIRRKIAGK